MKIGRKPVDLNFAGRSVRLNRDGNGVMHVAGRDDIDFAFGLGFAHGVDRMLQMLLLRLVGQGRLAEKLKSDETTQAVDIFMRQMAFSRLTAREVTELDDRTRAVLDAYCQGVNACLGRRGRPWELRLVGYRPEPWQPEDTLLTIKVMSYVGLAQTQGDVEKFIIQSVQGGVDPAKLRRLFAPHLDGFGDDLMELVRSVKIEQPLVPPEVRFLSLLPRATASNNWVLSGAMTQSGASIQCNDPHLEVNRLPAVWYETVGSLEGDYRMGITMPGVPGIVMGRTGRISMGFTYGFMDMIDFFIEEVRGGRCRRGDGWQDIEERRETIHRKGDKPFELSVFSTPRGTIETSAETSVLEDGFYLARAWTGERTGAAGSVNALIGLQKARNVKEAQLAAQTLGLSANMLISDVEGNIGYQQTGLSPVRRHSGLHPVPGWQERWDWQGQMPGSRFASLYNPDSGYICTANDDWNCGAEPPVVNMHMGSYRVDRIDQLLTGRQGLTLDDMKAVQCDLFSLQADRFLEALDDLLPDCPAAKILSAWDRRYDVGSKGPVLFERLYHALLAEVFGEMCFGVQPWRALVEETSLLVSYHQRFDKILLGDDPVWFGDEGRESMYRRVLQVCLGGIDVEALPTWGADHAMTMQNVFFAGSLPGFLGFDVGPLALPGGRSTVVQGQIFTGMGRRQSFAPSWRYVTDMADDTAQTVLPGGPSDRRFSGLYASEIEMWLGFQYKTVAPRKPD